MATDPPDEDDYERYLNPVLEREIERLAAQMADVLPPARPALPPDLQALEHAVDIVEVQLGINIEPEYIEPYMFGRFEALATIRGGMGLVLKARDLQLDRLVAIKLWLRSGPEARAALIAEAQTLAKLKHPNVVTIYEPGVWNLEPGVYEDRIYFVMEWIEGVDGHDWMEQRRSWREVRRVYVEAGKGLAAAHDAGIQHRDFKPSNILIGWDERVVVADFGVADSLLSLPETEEPASPAGTPSYMAPERLRGKRGDARSDQFSFCVAMWRALYRQRPYAGDTKEELLESIECGELRETPGVNVPAWLRAVVRKGLADNPDDRYRDMRELLAALLDEPPGESSEAEPGADGEPPGEVDERVLHTPADKPGRGSSRLAFVLPMMVILLFILAGIGAEVVMNMTPEPVTEPVYPCATLDVEPLRVDSVVFQVCTLIQDEHFEAADMLWEREFIDRVGLDPANQNSEELGELSLIVAATFLEKAQRLEHDRPADAQVVAELAWGWATRAAVRLGQDEPRVKLVLERSELMVTGRAVDDR